MARTVSITTIGCKVNQFESEALMAQLREKGYRIVPFESGADITIINTCTVTHRADFDSRQRVRKALRHRPDSLIIVTGCYAQVASEEILRLEGVHYLLGNREKHLIPILLPLMEEGKLPMVQVSDLRKERAFPEISAHTFHHHTRAFLKIQDGCNGLCSYCIIPQARGPSRSLVPEKIIEQLRILKERGFKEVVLTGVQIGSYGRDLQPPFPLEKLLQWMETEETPPRIRLSSLEPLDFSEGLIFHLSQSKKICPHLHLPIQSADDEILKSMKRGYDRHFLDDLLETLHRKIPALSMGVDVIIGFPGETEERFKRTYQWVESNPISYLHVFPFSKRKGTAAAQLSQQIDPRVIRDRAERVRELGKRKRRSFYQQFLHQTLDVLVEDRREKGSGRWRGLSRNYIPVFLLDSVGSELANQEIKIRVTDWNDRGLWGEWVEDANG